MQIVEISEPISNTTPLKSELVIGIDFGTTHSLVAVSRNHQAEIIKIRNDMELVSSIIGFNKNEIIIGEKALHCENHIKSIKRLLAKSYSEIQCNKNLVNLSTTKIHNDNNIPKVSLLGTIKTLPEIASEIFKYLKFQTEQTLKMECKKAVISVPAHFNNEARGQVMLAAKLAGFEVLRLISEPTAAAYAYGFSNANKGSYLVYDFGGGTFDVSILNMQEGVLQVIAVGGDNMLGGDDIDYAIAKHIGQKLNFKISSEIIQIAKELKENFASKDRVTIYVKKNQLTITQEEYINIILPIIDKTITIAQEVLSEAENIVLDGIILVGGSSKIKQISDKLKNAFKVHIYCDINPYKVVALGAAMQAENLISKSNVLLLDVVPLSIGLELYGGIVEKVIMRNTPIPYSITKKYTTHTNSQTGIKFHILQGEREMAKDCRSLANFELTGIAPARAGRTKIEVTFTMDANGILLVSASNDITGQIHNIEIKPSYGLNRESINNMLETAYQNLHRDHLNKLLVESQITAKNLINSIQLAKKNVQGIQTKVEYNKIEQAINTLQKIVNSSNLNLITMKTNHLNKLATSFFQRYINKSIDSYLKHRHIDELKI